MHPSLPDDLSADAPEHARTRESASRSRWLFASGALVTAVSAVVPTVRYFLQVHAARQDAGVAHHDMSGHAAPASDMVMPAMDHSGAAMWVPMCTAVLGVLLVVAGAAVHARGVAPTLRTAPAVLLSTRRRAVLLGLACAALVVDVSKTSTLGFVLPAMREEYGVGVQASAVLPLFALSGTIAGSVIWGSVTDRLGPRVCLLLAGAGFTATALCGDMATFTQNVVTCFLMGFTVGGLVPVLFAMLGSTVPRHRVYLVGSVVAALGSAGGYAVAATLSTTLMPAFGWRAMWLQGAATGILLMLAASLVPRTLGLAVTEDERVEVSVGRRVDLPAFAFLAGVLSLGFLIWLPRLLEQSGVEAADASRMLSQQSLLAVPVALAIALLALRHEPGRVTGGVALFAGAAVAATGVVLLTEVSGAARWLAIAALVVAANLMIATVLPLAAARLSARSRGAGTGRLAAASKVGGLVGPPVLAVTTSSNVGLLATFTVVAGALVVVGLRLGQPLTPPPAPARISAGEPSSDLVALASAPAPERHDQAGISAH